MKNLHGEMSEETFKRVEKVYREFQEDGDGGKAQGAIEGLLREAGHASAEYLAFYIVTVSTDIYWRDPESMTEEERKKAAANLFMKVGRGESRPSRLSQRHGRIRM